MVNRVWGEANHQQIEFTRIEGNKWKALIPATMSGEYFVSLYAQDAGGNTTFYANIILAVYNSLFRSDTNIKDKKEELLKPEIKCNIKVMDKNEKLFQKQDFDWM